MKHFILAGLIAAMSWTATEQAEASVFPQYVETTDVFFDGFAGLDYDPILLGGQVFGADAPVDIGFAPDFSTGFLTLFDTNFATVLDGDLLDVALSTDGGVNDDSFAMLFRLATGATPFAIATFVGDLDGGGTTDFFQDGVFFAPGDLTVTGATVIPLPASVLLLLGALGATAATRRVSRLRRKA